MFRGSTEGGVRFVLSAKKADTIMENRVCARGDWFVMGIIGSVLIAVGAFLIAKWIKD